MPTQKKTTIGGQAIIEGIVMKGPRRVCTVVRKANGELVVKEEDAHQPSAFWKLPVLRGAYGLFMAMKDGIQAINYSASFFEDEEVDAPPEHAAMPRAATMATAAVASRRNGFLRA